MKVVVELSGIFMFLTGFVFLINYFSGITGYVVTTEISREFSSMAGIILVVGGLMLFISGRHVQTNNKIKINKNVGLKKMKIAIASKIINYNSFKRLILESGYNIVEAKDYTTVFSPNDEVVKDENGYPLVISPDKKNDKKLLIEILKKIIETSK